MARRATSLKAMFWADRRGAAAMTTQCATPVGIEVAPRERLHAAERAAHHRREALDAERIGEAGLGAHPVFDRDNGKVRAVRPCRWRD